MNRKRFFLLLLVLFFISSCASLRELTSGESDNVINVAIDDAAMNTAIQQAQDTLPIFTENLQNPQPGQTGFSIKARFPYGSTGEAEHMWLYDVSYADNQFTGYIGNTPIYVTEYQYGDQVTISSEDVSDWMIIQDERMLGGFTMFVLLGDMTDEQRQEFYEENGFLLGEQAVTE
jgi:uncharacterized protein YegJ (DUF2314 family)